MSVIRSLPGLAILVMPALAQFTSGIQGTVYDSSQAVLPDSEVIVVNQSTQVTLQARTNENGFFRLNQLAPAVYRIEVRRAGFKSWVQANVVLEGNVTREVYPVLSVGDQVATVEVQAAGAVVETGTARVGRSIDSKTVEDAPMLGRNIYGAVAALAPGITGSGGLFGGASGSGSLGQDSFQLEPGFQVNAAGQRQEQNEYQVDGTSVNGNSRDGIANLTPQPDTVQEIRISANAFSADKGRNSGALVEVFTKSGTNRYHGTVSEYHSNNSLTGRSVFQKGVPVFRRNEYGFTFGGPVIKNRTFIFGSFYNLSASAGQTDVVIVETPEFRNFVSSNFPNGLAAKFLSLGAPTTYPTADFRTVAQVRASNPGRYPSDRFPDSLPVLGTAFVNQTLNRPAKQGNVRMDHNMRQYKDRAYFSFFSTDSDGQQPNARSILRVVTPNEGKFARLTWSHTFSPSMINEASASYTRAAGGNPGIADHLGLPNATVTGLSAGFSQGGFYFWAHNNYSWRDVLSIVRGNHQLRMGVDIDRQQSHANQKNSIRPGFTFANMLDFAQDLPFSQSGPTLEIQAGTMAQNVYRRLYMVYAGAFFQDDWKVSPRLTINLGLRWDYFGHWATGANSKIPYPLFTPGSGSTFADQVANGSMQVRGGGKGYFTENKPNGFGPRIGFAWDVFGNGSTAIRGGYGVFYSRIANLSYLGVSNFNSPAWGNPNLTLLQPGVQFSYAEGNADGSIFPVPPGFQFKVDSRGGIVGSRVQVGGISPNMDQPRTQDWTVSLQRRLSGDFMFEADYLGSHSGHLFVNTDVNRIAGDLPAHNGALTRLNPSFGPIIFGRAIGVSTGHIGSLMLGRRFAAGWSVRGIYTFGRALDYASSNDNGVGGGRNMLDAFNIAAQRGRADYDIKRRVAIDSVWELPSPWKHGLKSKLVDGWKLSTIAIFSTGRPFTVFTSAPYPNGDYNGDGFNWDVPNTPAFGNRKSTSRSDFITGLFKAAEFPKPAPGQQGSLGRNTFEGPGLANVNLGVIKATKIPWFTAEGATFEVRGDVFNLFNRVNLTPPSADLSNTLFGRSTDQSLPRTATFGLRLQF